MKLYFGLTSAVSLAPVQAIIEPMLSVGPPEAQAAVCCIKEIIESPMQSGEIHGNDFHQTVVLFALVKMCRDKSDENDSLVTMADELGSPVFFDRDEDWRSYLVDKLLIPGDRMDEAQDLFVAYGAMDAILDLSTMGQASPASDSDFCI